MAIRTEYNLRLKSGIVQVSVPVTQRPRPDMDDVTLRYLQDLLAWVEENQARLNAAEWGVDLPTVESQLGSHRGLHRSIEEFRPKIERARADEVGRGQGMSGLGVRECQPPSRACRRRRLLCLHSGSFTVLLCPPQAQLSPGPQTSYRDYLSKLDVQYEKLLVSRWPGDGRATEGAQAETLLLSLGDAVALGAPALFAPVSVRSLADRVPLRAGLSRCGLCLAELVQGPAAAP